MSRVKELKHIETPHTPERCPRWYLHIASSLGNKQRCQGLLQRLRGFLELLVDQVANPLKASVLE